LLSFCTAVLFCLHTSAQKQKTTTVATTSATNYEDVFKSLKWRNIGPFRGGRANAISGVKGNDKLYYVGYTGGGVWKTEDGGLQWTNISDGYEKPVPCNFY
jgi:hypothetical protein